MRDSQLHGEAARLANVMTYDPGNPNGRQVGGSHYSGSEYQHWDYASDLRMRHVEGSATKYLSRAGNKPEEPRLKDLEKAVHYLEKLYDLYRSNRVASLVDVQGASFDAALPTARFIAASMSGHAFTPRVVAALVGLSRWGSYKDLEVVLELLAAEVEEEKRKPKPKIGGPLGA